MSVAVSIIAGIFIFGLPLLVYLLQPILRANRGALTGETATSEIEELLTERERSYTALADLDFDYECGKISKEDYRQLRAALIQETALVLARIDQKIAQKRESRAFKSKRPRRATPPLEPVSVTEDVIEREIAQFKRARQRL